MMSNGPMTSPRPSVHVRRLTDRIGHTVGRLMTLAGEADLQVADLPTVQLPWYEIRAEATRDGDGQPSCATVFLFDEIGGSLGVSAKKFTADLEALDVDELKVRINSPGGSVFDSITIFNALNHHRAQVTVYIDGLAASGASVVAMAGDQIVMMPGSQMMIHDAAMLQDGNAADMAAASTFLDRQSVNVADIYAQARGGEPAEWRELMIAETWAFAREAVALGLADSVMELERADSDLLPDKMTRSFGDYVAARYRYAGRAAAPPPQVRRTVAAKPARAVYTRERTRPAELPAPSSDVREAAARRREMAENLAAAGQHRSMVPLGAARRLSTAWCGQRVGSAFTRADLPPRLSVREERRDGKSFHVVEGYATVYEQGYEMYDWAGPYTETVGRGAAKKTLAAKPDVVFLVNHKGLAMARTVAGTLELWEDHTGMADRGWLNPSRGDVNDLVINIGDGNTTEQSFAFMITEGEWSPDFTQYRISEFDIDRGDVSAVNFGANPYTSVSARGREILDELDQLPVGVARAALAQLQRRADLGQMTPADAAKTVPAPAVRGNARSLTQLEAWLASADAGR